MSEIEQLRAEVKALSELAVSLALFAMNHERNYVHRSEPSIGEFDLIRITDYSRPVEAALNKFQAFRGE